MPTNLEEWINFNFSKEFLEKVKSHEDNDFMGKFMFEKAEMTLHYLEKVIAIFETLGM